MKSCVTCGMPLEGEHVDDFGFESVDGPVCRFDSEDGVIKSSRDIFQGGVAFFLGAATDGDRDLAERLIRTNMKHLAYWQAHPFEELEGAQVSPEEFQAAMARL
ncbi:hypothetical protein EPN81_02750 [Patescibacteria group bacterium]|nr:MAG: hypothetical protein EPN81_02750 [Patescibacteria group bacterium]